MYRLFRPASIVGFLYCCGAQAHAAVANAMRLKFGRSLLIGLGVLVFVPIAAAAAAVTVVGIPIGLVLLLSYLALLLVSCPLAAIALGDHWATRHCDGFGRPDKTTGGGGS